MSKMSFVYTPPSTKSKTDEGTVDAPLLLSSVERAQSLRWHVAAMLEMCLATGRL